MLICIDIGNTNITIGGFEGESLKFTARLATDSKRTADQYAIEIRDVLHIYEVGRSEVTDAAICSVVPAVGSAVAKAIEKYSTPTVVIDLGTATTISVLGKNGEFLGGAIAAGVKLTLEALATKTAQLPSVSIEAPRNVIGTNTADCMKSGIVVGAAAMIDGMVTKIEQELGLKATVVATGGLAPEVVKFCDHKIVTDDNLLLDGLRIIYNKNKN